MMDTSIDEYIPSVKQSRRKAIAAESYDPSCDDNESVVYHHKTETQMQCLQDAAKDILFFRNCDKEKLKILYGAMFEKRVLQDDVIIRQGDEGDNFYIIEKGIFEININDGDKQKYVATLKDKGYFGELSLLYNCARGATITSKSDGILWGLDQQTFRKIVVKATARKRESFEKMLKNLPILQSLTAYELMNLTDALTEIQFSKNERIVNEGESADRMYFIMRGDVSVHVVDKNTKIEKEVTKLKRGEYFGELSLILKKPRVASVVSTSDDTRCAVLDILAFERLLGPCVNIMRRNIEMYDLERKMVGLDSIASEINVSLSNKLDKVELEGCR